LAGGAAPPPPPPPPPPPRLQLTLLLLLLLLLQALHLLHEPRHGAALCCRVLLELLDAEYERLVLLRQAADLRM
jgi:hypothetical protein